MPRFATSTKKKNTANLACNPSFHPNSSLTLKSVNNYRLNAKVLIVYTGLNEKICLFMKKIVNSFHRNALSAKKQ
jgi:hypothetical protein